MDSIKNIQDIQSLEQRFDYMFRGPHISMEYYRGWFPGFVDLCVEIDAVLGKHKSWFRWVQVKEKLGGCRMHYSLRPDDFKEGLDEDDQVTEFPEELVRIRAGVRQVVDYAARQMKKKCCVCGEFGVVDHHNGWLVTLCNFHLPAARAARGDTRLLRELTAVPATPRDVEVWRPS